MTERSFPAVILAGGRSQRMGRDKAGLLLGRQTLAERAAARLAAQTDRIAINSNIPLELSGPGLIPRLADPVAGHRGPLAGILAAMIFAASHEDAPSHVATAAIDSPFFPRDLIARLSALAIPGTIVTATACGRSHPVFGLWPLSLKDALHEWLAGSDLSVQGFLTHHPHAEADFPALQLGLEELDPFFNVNTPEDFEKAKAIEAEFHP